MYHAEVVTSEEPISRYSAVLHVIDVANPAFLSHSGWFSSGRFNSPSFVDPKLVGKRKLQVIEDELSTLQQVRHANIQSVYGAQICWRDDEHNVQRLEIVTEPHSATSLADILTITEKVPADRAIEYLRQLASGLSALHEHGLCHRGSHYIIYESQSYSETFR